MKYKVLDYEILKKDGTTVKGSTPYRGEDDDQASLEQFIKGYFTGPDGSYKSYTVTTAKDYQNDEEWIREVHQMDSFGYLQRVNNFGGELLKKYDLPRQDGK